MFAVIRSGGKQYTVKQDDVLIVDRLDGDEGAKVTFGDIMMLGGDKPKHGAPLISGASVAAEIVKQGRNDKVVAFKKKRRKNTHRKRGHRQQMTTVKITGITAG